MLDTLDRPSSSACSAPRCALAAISRRSSSRTGDPRPPVSTTARSRSSARVATGAPGSGSSSARPTGYRPHRRPVRGRAPSCRRGGGRGGPRQRRGEDRTVACTASTPPARTRSRCCPEAIEKAAKVALLPRADEAARGEGGAIEQVTAGYGDSRRRILVANSDGLLAERRPGARRCSPCSAWPSATPACRPVTSRSAAPSVGSCSTRSTSRSTHARSRARR